MDTLRLCGRDHVPPADRLPFMLIFDARMSNQGKRLELGLGI